MSDDPSHGTDSPTGSVLPGSRHDFVPPRFQRLGDFELLREIGRGGMGIVYEAHQTSLDRRVALKILPPSLGLTPEAVARFEREALAAAKLHHTNIVPVYAIGEDQGCHFYAMELVEGQSLARMLDDRKKEDPTPSRASVAERDWFEVVARLMADVADALHYAHARGVTHRDIKPANLLLSMDGRLCIGDFGLARMAQEPALTASGSFLGTPAYMSPEQVAAGRVKLDHRTDIYSLGAVLYEMLTRERAVPGDTRDEILSGILMKEPQAPRRINPRVPLDLETICQKAMEKDPDRRYATAGALADDLRRYLQRGLIKARRAGPLRRALKFVRRHPVATTSAAAALAVVALGAIAWQQSAGRAEATAARAISEARFLTEVGEYRESLEAADRALAIAPGNDEARLLRAQSLLRIAHWKEGVEEARRVLVHDRGNWEAHLLLALAARKRGVPTIRAEDEIKAAEEAIPEKAEAAFLRGLASESLREQIQWFDRALVLDPGHAQALAERSAAQSHLRNPPAAIADAERLMVARPRSVAGKRRLAWVYWREKDSTRALELYEGVVRLDPRDPETLFQRANVYYELARYDDAIADLTRAIELDPSRPELYRSRSMNYRLKREWELAIADARRAVETDPDYLLGHGELLSALWGAGKKDETREALEAVRARSKDWVDPTSLAHVHDFSSWFSRMTRDFGRAVAEADQVIALRPRSTRGFQLRAQALQEERGPDAIAEDCDRMAELSLDEPEEVLDRAALMRELCRRTDQAMSDDSKAIELAPHWAQPYYERARLMTDERRYADAVRDLDTAIELQPGWAIALHQRGYVYAQMDRLQEALADYEKAAALGLAGANAIWARSVVLARLGRTDEGLKLLDDWIDKNPKHALSLRRRAEFLFWLGRIDDSIAGLGRAVEAQPDDPVNYMLRAEVLRYRPGSCEQTRADVDEGLSRGAGRAEVLAMKSWIISAFGPSTCAGSYDPHAAVELARKALVRNPRSANSLKSLGIALYRSGRFEEALEASRKASDLGFADEQPNLFVIAMTLQRLGRRSESRASYDRAVKAIRFPNNPEMLFFKTEAARTLGIAN